MWVLGFCKRNMEEFISVGSKTPRVLQAESNGLFRRAVGDLEYKNDNKKCTEEDQLMVIEERTKTLIWKLG